MNHGLGKHEVTFAHREGTTCRRQQPCSKMWGGERRSCSHWVISQFNMMEKIMNILWNITHRWDNLVDTGHLFLQMEYDNMSGCCCHCCWATTTNTGIINYWIWCLNLQTISEIRFLYNHTFQHCEEMQFHLSCVFLMRFCNKSMAWHLGKPLGIWASQLQPAGLASDLWTTWLPTLFFGDTFLGVKPTGQTYSDW